MTEATQNSAPLGISTTQAGDPEASSGPEYLSSSDYDSIDSDHDGYISTNEWTGKGLDSAKFRQIAGTDEKISLQEFINYTNTTPEDKARLKAGSYLQEDFAKIDSDGDGKISQEEWIRQGLDISAMGLIGHNVQIIEMNSQNIPVQKGTEFQISVEEWDSYITANSTHQSQAATRSAPSDGTTGTADTSTGSSSTSVRDVYETLRSDAQMLDALAVAVGSGDHNIVVPNLTNSAYADAAGTPQQVVGDKLLVTLTNDEINRIDSDNDGNITRSEWTSAGYAGESYDAFYDTDVAAGGSVAEEVKDGIPNSWFNDHNYQVYQWGYTSVTDVAAYLQSHPDATYVGMGKQQVAGSNKPADWLLQNVVLNSGNGLGPGDLFALSRASTNMDTKDQSITMMVQQLESLIKFLLKDAKGQ